MTEDCQTLPKSTLDEDDRRRCAMCGCSDDDPCVIHGTPCCWIRTSDLDPVCSGCVSIEELVADEEGRAWLDVVQARAATGLHVPRVPCRAESEDDELEEGTL